MLSLFFIRRPIFAAVISIVIVVLGIVSLVKLPIARYPDLAPPTISVSASYPGADAATVADTVAATIEKQVNGVEDMIYMSSVSANDGSMNLTVTFESGVDLDTANVLVQNRVALAEPRLPEEVKRTGVSVKKKSTDIVMFITLTSPEGTYDAAYLSNFANLRIRDELLRVGGVGDALVWGVGEFSMRIWLDPDQLRVRNLSATEVVNAIREQNVQVAAGRVGAAPAPNGTAFEYVLSAHGRLIEIKEFENIIVATGEDGRIIRIGDVARVELGSDVYNFNSKLNGTAATAIAIYQIPGSNLMDVADGVAQALERLSASFPNDVEYKVVYDSTWVVDASIKEVIITLIATVILVVLTVYLFLQNFRATLIPTITIPVALIGTFSILLAFGFSLNILTLFGLVLVIGIVVDDAILVVENTFVHLDKGLSGKEAAEECMKEVTGPVIATTLVLLAVFIPTAMMSGITGTMFKQFAITISIATVFSSINALTLAPALCGVLLKPGQAKPRGLFELFNVSVQASNKFYQGLVRMALKSAIIGLCIFGAVIYFSGKGMGSLPTGFVPQEDEGYCMVAVQLPDGATLERTNAVMEDVQKIVSATPGVVDCLAISGYSLIDGAAGVNAGFCLAVFDHWDERPTPELHQSGILAAMQRQFGSIQEAMVYAFPMPSLPGVGTTGGFTYMLQDIEGGGLDELARIANGLIQDANQQASIGGARTTFRASVPQIFVDIDREQVKRTGTSMTSVFNTLQIYLGSMYVNDFTLFGRIFKVTAQADSQFRSEPSDINRLAVKGADGRMIPLGAIVSLEERLGPQNIIRFNMMPSVKVLGNPTVGYSSGQAMDAMESLSATELPSSMSYSWSELSYQEKQAATGLAVVFGFAVLMVYLLLAAQYESWTLPVSVCLSVPTALLGAVVAIKMRGMENNVYTQIGLILLIALSTKTAILLTEFASVQRQNGMSIFDSAIEAVKLRFRAVLMTALSFILGVIPLLIASGAGSASRQILGTAVFGGMLAATALSLIVVPMMYFVIQTVVEKISGGKPSTKSTLNEDVVE
ncbi:multidrug efflux RND transporter permease subunit [Opitutales bacterium]|jgi:hydrophobic/amphiphilic exporter-1 (mainly G- bacteria), HAE1 family|nr:multidrug efflux RND transporter permease subunit [Planctomycetota bacterium]MDA9589923.1 multidrug efflux RND transporter permease subunit [Opitutales bacterium]MDB2506672.1 multidrug efflux RND transporter permease subunit [Opitutales bacterium]